MLGSGAQAARHQPPHDRAFKEETAARATLEGQAAEAETFKEGDGLVRVGYSYVSLDELDKGSALIQKCIAKGKLKRPEDVKLRLGMVQLQHAKTKPTGVQSLRSVKGNESTAETARVCAVVG